MRIYKMYIASMLQNRHAHPFQVESNQRVRMDLFDNLANTCEQALIVEVWITDCHSIAVQLFGFPHEPGSVGKGSDRNRPVVGRHAAELVASDKGCCCSELGCTHCRHHAGWPSTYNYDVHDEVPQAKL